MAACAQLASLGYRWSAYGILKLAVDKLGICKIAIAVEIIFSEIAIHKTAFDEFRSCKDDASKRGAYKPGRNKKTRRHS